MICTTFLSQRFSWKKALSYIKNYGFFAFLQVIPGIVEDNTQNIVPAEVTPVNWGIRILLIVLILLVVGAAAAALYFFSVDVRKRDREEKSKEGVVFEVSVPKGNEIEIEVAKQMFSALYNIGKTKGIKKYLEVQPVISFEIVGLPESIRFFVHAPAKLAPLVERAISGSYPNAELREVTEHNIFFEGYKVAYTSLKLDDEPYKPIKIYEDLKNDPIENITSALSKYKAGEGGALQILITPDNSDAMKMGSKYLARIEQNNADPEKKRMVISQELSQRIDRKVSNLSFRTVINLVCSAKTLEIAKSNLDNLISVFSQFSYPGGNKFTKDEGSRFTPKREFMTNFVYRRMPLEGGSILNIEELATIYHFPNKNVETPYIKWVLSKTVPPPEEMAQNGLWLGRSTYRGEHKHIFMKDDGDDRRRHMYVIGQTGTGKSFFITQMLMQDIYAGRGCAYIDPHGTDIERVLNLIPAERMEDVIYFNPSDVSRPFGWNIIDYYSEDDKHLIVNSFLGMMRKMYDPHNQGIVGPIFERVVRNSMLTAMAKKGSTLVEVIRIIMDFDMTYVKENFLPFVKDDLVRSYWLEEFAKTESREKSERLGYLTSKFDSFVTNSLIRNIIGQSQNTINIRQIMDQKKILLINLSKGAIGEENSNFLGLLIVPAILRAAFARGDMPESERADFYLYVDEFQNFATEEFATILAEARKYRLNLIVANQYISQLSEKVRDAVFGNAGSKIAFRVGAEDADYLSKEYAPAIEAQDLVNLPNFNAYVKLLVNGINPPPFSMTTFMAAQEFETRFASSHEIRNKVVELSRIKFGRDREIVEQEIKVRGKLGDIKDQKPNNNMPGFPRF